MADFLDATFTITYTKETPAQTYKMMDVSQKMVSRGFEGGEIVLQPKESGVRILDEVTNVYIVAEKPISISVTLGTLELTDMMQFAYASDLPFSVQISNEFETESVKVTYAGGTRVLD